MKRHSNPFPGVTTTRDRHGKHRYRLRRKVKGRKVDCYLPAPYGSVEFRAAYEAAVEGIRVTTRSPRSGTVAFLIKAYLESASFRELAEGTRKGKRKRLDWIRSAIGDGRYATMEARHVEALMQKKGGPVAANRLKKDLSQLFRFAAKHYSYKGQNPATLADSHRISRTGYHTWTDEEIGIFRDKHSSGTKARLALEIFLGTGAARQDTAALTRANIRHTAEGKRLHYRRGKTGQEVDLPILDELATELTHLPPTQVVLLAQSDGVTAYRPQSLGKLFRGWCMEAELPHCSAHGLRKAGARRLAEAGASEFEVMAFLAHGSTKEASRYVAAANRTLLTTSGLKRLRDE